MVSSDDKGFRYFIVVSAFLVNLSGFQTRFLAKIRRFEVKLFQIRQILGDPRYFQKCYLSFIYTQVIMMQGNGYSRTFWQERCNRYELPHVLNPINKIVKICNNRAFLM